MEFHPYGAVAHVGIARLRSAEMSSAEVDADPDAVLLHCGQELVTGHAGAVRINAHGEQVPRVIERIGRLGKRQQPFDVGERSEIASGQRLPAGIVAFESTQLHDRHRGVHVRQVVFEARLDDFGLRSTTLLLTLMSVEGEAVKAQPADALGERRIGQAHDPALGAGQVLDRLKGEDRRAAPPDRIAFVACTGAVGGILDDRDAVRLSQLVQGIEIECTREVHGHDRLRSWSDGGAHPSGIRHERVAVDVDEDGLRAQQLDEVDRRHPRHRGSDHLVARPDAESHERRCIPAVAEHTATQCAEPRCGPRTLLQLGDSASRRGPARAHDFDDGVDLGLGDRRAGKRNEFSGHRCAISKATRSLDPLRRCPLVYALERV